MRFNTRSNPRLPRDLNLYRADELPAGYSLNRLRFNAWELREESNSAVLGVYETRRYAVNAAIRRSRGLNY